ncbi:MAG TPA: septal ring lytic transglycosylase RlpA family protein [Candidatus Acidoferrales bacterium]|nr:septal ring lytic transglycosylase RlpA family protein [Candidatus Acidoferrales bacterium]
MQTKLRVLGFVIVASLLWITPMSAVSQRPKVQAKAKKMKVQYIGLASWYGPQHQGRKMANGQRFDRHKYTAASWYFPLGTVIRVVNLKNGESVEVTITDRGPNLRLHRILDLSEAAADLLGYVDDGLTSVFLYPVSSFNTTAASFDSVGLIETVTQASGEYTAHLSAVPM